MAPHDSEAFGYGISPTETSRKQNSCRHGRHVEEQTAAFHLVKVAALKIWLTDDRSQ